MNVYPRLDQRVLLRLINEYRQDSRTRTGVVERIRAMVDGQVLAPGRISHSPVGLELVGEDRLWRLRAALRSIAERHGCPATRYPDRSPSWADYDRETAVCLHSQMGIPPTDAGARDVWAHVNGWLVPDLVLWRWWVADGDADTGDARYGWGPRWFARNQMGRLWWRHEILGELYSEGRLGEDQVTAILERPSLGFNPPLARSIARHWGERLDESSAGAEDLMRDATKRLRRLLPSVAVYSLPPEQLDDLVALAFEQSVALLKRENAL